MYPEKKRKLQRFNKLELDKIFILVIFLLFLINFVSALDIGAKEESKFFNGTIDEFRIWNRSINEFDIHRHSRNNTAILTSNLTRAGAGYHVMVDTENTTTISSLKNSTILKITNTAPAINYTNISTTDFRLNNTLQNITFNFNVTDSDNDLVFNTTANWYENNRSLIVLNIPFNNNSAADVSGLENNGRTANNTSVNRTNCFYGSCAHFDGINDYINVSDSNALDMLGNMTVEAWVRISSTGKNHTVYTKEGIADADSNILMQIFSNNKFRVVADADNSNAYDADEMVESSTSLSANLWYHLAFTYNNANITLYVNGVLENNSNVAGSIPATSSPIQIGKRVERNLDDFNGSLDEIRIWNITLPAADIYQHYLNNTFFLSSNLTGKNNTYHAMIVSSDNETYSVKVNTTLLIVLNTAPIVTDVFVKPFLPSSGDNLVCNFNVTDIDSEDTLFRVNVTWHRLRENILTNWIYDNENLILVAGDPGSNLTSSVGNVESANTTQQDFWKCSVNVYDNQEWSGFVNSSEVKILEYNITTVFVAPAAGQKVNASSNETISLNWTLRTREYGCDNFTAALYHFEDSVVDACESNDAILINTTNFTLGYFGKGLIFDGIGDFANVTSSIGSGNRLNITGNITLEAWIKTGTNGKVISKSDANEDGYYLSLNGGKARISIDNGTLAVVDSSRTVNDNNWHHVLGSFATSTNVNIYVDGILESSNTTNIPSTIATVNLPLVIGANSTGKGDFFNGTIDEARISNKTRTIEEFREYYRYGSFTQNTQAIGRNVTFINISWFERNIELETDRNTILYFDFDEGSRISASDNSIFKTDGRIYGANYTEGRHDLGLIFSNNGSYVNSSLRGFTNSSGSLELWLKPNYFPSDGEARVFASLQTEISNRKDGLVLLLHFNNNTNDSSSFGNQGVEFGKVNCGLSVSGRFGTACSFDGVDDLINVSTYSINTTSITTEAWFKLSGFKSSGDEVIIQQQNSTNGVGRELIFIDDNSDDRIKTNLGEAQLSSGVVVQANTWHHAAITFNGSSLSIYVDGLLRNTTAETFECQNCSITIGSGKGVDHFNGTIDEVAIYNRSLSGNEVLESYNGLALYKNSTGTLKFVIGNSSLIYNEGLEKDQWKFIAATWDSVTARLYVDSELIESKSISHTNNWSNEFIIGSGYRGINNSNATIDEFRLLNRTLTQEEILNDYKKGLSEIYLQARTSRDNVTYSNWTGNVDVPYYNIINETLFYLTFDDIILNSQRLPGRSGLDFRAYEGYDSETRAAKGLNINQNDTNLVAYYKLDEIDDLQGAIDYSGHNLNGSIGNSTATTKPILADGIAGKAYQFDGVNDFVNLTNLSSFDITGELTISAWMKSNSGNGYILAKANGISGGQSYRLTINNSQASFGIADGTSFANGGEATGGTISNGTWHHVTGVYDPGNAVRVYVDGVEVASDTSSVAASISDSGAVVTIGSASNHDNFFNGIIDEVAIWNKTLIEQEIRSLAYDPGFSYGNYIKDGRFIKGIYVNKSTVLSYPIGASLDKDTLLLCRFDATSDSVSDFSCDTGEFGNFSYLENLDASDNLVSAWKFEGNASDLLLINNGTESGVNETSGYVGKAFSFDGIDDFVNVTSSMSARNSLNITGSLTLEAWVKTSGTIGRIIGKTDNSNEDGYYLSLNGGKARISIDNGTLAVVDSSRTVNDNNWHHVLGSFATSTNVNIYVDGILESSNTTNIPSTIATVNLPLVIGANSTGKGDFFNGTIDEAAVYNRSLTAYEIASHAAAKYAKNTGYYGGGYFVANHSTLTFKQENNIVREFGTISLWIKPEFGSTFPSNQVFFDTDGTGSNEFEIFYNASTDSFELNANNRNLLTSGTQTFNALDWKFVAVTYDYNNDRYRIYVDGTLKATATNALDAPYYTQLYLGSNSQATSFANSTVDEFRISKKILTDNEIYQEYLGNLNKSRGTLRFWAKTDWEGNDNEVRYFFTTRDQNISIFKLANNTLYFRYGTGLINYNISTWNTSWTSIGVIWNPNNFSLFIDGIERANGSGTNLDNFNLSSFMFIGSNATGGQQADAVFDDFVITNRELSKEEIKPLGYVDSEGSRVNASGNVSFLQWRAIFATASIENTGEIKNVTVSFNTPPRQPTLTFPGSYSGVNTRDINFRFNTTDPDGDLITYFIFINDRLNASTTGENLTINLQEGRYNWSVKAGDGTENSTFTQAFNLTVDITLPTITNIIRRPSPTAYNNDNVTLNATIIDLNLYNVWVETNYTGNFVNYTNNTLIAFLDNFSYYIAAGENYSISNFSNQENVTFRWYANDTAGNIRISNFSSFKIENRISTTPSLTTPANGTWAILYKNITFNWTRSFDPDNDTLNYTFELARIENFNSLALNITNITDILNYTINSTQMPQATGYWWRARSYDGYNYSNYSNERFVDITYAKITITSPADQAIVDTASSVTINANEADNGAWISSATFKVVGDNQDLTRDMTNNTAAEVTTWTGTYTVPSVSSRTVRLYIFGKNDSLNLNVNDSIYLRVTRPFGAAVGNPNISRFTTDPTYVEVNRSVNITFIVDADVLLKEVVALVVWPNETRNILTRAVGSDGNDSNSFVYYYNYTFDANLTGNYTIRINITDVNYPNSGLVLGNTTVYSNNTQQINITGNNINNFTLRDLSSRRQMFKGQNVTQLIVPGRYDLDVEAGDNNKIKYNLINISLLSGNVNACNFTEIDETVTPPANSRAVDQWITSCNGVTPHRIEIIYDYSAKTAAITNEDNLELYECENIVACSWEKVTLSLNTNSDKITANISNFSLFMVSEDTATSTVTVGGGGGASGGGGGGASEDRLISIDIISPAPLSLYTNDTIIAPLFIKNTGEIFLRGIQLFAETESTDLTLELTENSIDSLAIGEEVSADLIIRSNKELTSDTHEIIITARVADPQFQDSVKFFVNLLEFGIGQRQIVVEKIEFLRKLLEGNPECLELQELIDNAEQSLEKEEFEKSLKTVEAAIQACKELVSLQGKELQIPKKISTDVYIAIAEVIVLLLIIHMIYRYYRRRHQNK